MVIGLEVFTEHDFSIAVARISASTLALSTGPSIKTAASVEHLRILLIGHCFQEPQSVHSFSLSFTLQEPSYFANGFLEMLAVPGLVEPVLREKVCIDLGHRHISAEPDQSSLVHTGLMMYQSSYRCVHLRCGKSSLLAVVRRIVDSRRSDHSLPRDPFEVSVIVPTMSLTTVTSDGQG